MDAMIIMIKGACFNFVNFFKGNNIIMDSRGSKMVRLELEKEKIELKEYSDDASLQELTKEVESFRLTNHLKTRYCKGCGECCNQPIPVMGLDIMILQENTGLSLYKVLEKYIVFPQKPNLNSRRDGIKEFVNMCGLSKSEAALLYEYNQCEPLILPRKKDGTCSFLNNQTGLCTIYEYRPFTCGLYICTMGDELSMLQEMIVRQGTWYAYSLLGWVDRGEISHNPFLNADSYDRVYIKDFKFNSERAIEQLFFYF